VDDKVHIALQDSVHSPPVGLLDVHLPLVAARLGMELRIPAVPEMSIRDVGYANYVPAILASLDPSNSNCVWVSILPIDYTESLAYQRHFRSLLFGNVR
jgi:hypothetical protein